MRNYLITFIIALITSVGVVAFSTPVIWDTPPIKLGTTSYPTSLDSLTNPSGTDSVATVSHSGQHANANDAIEAIEGKTGIGASTPTSGTVLYGSGTGSSIWSASPILTGLFTSLGFISNASSTVIGNLNITGNSTSTNATTTNLFSTTASSTNLYGANFNGFGLSTCSGTSFLHWSGGSFSCGIPGGSGNVLNYMAATTTVGMSVGNSFDAATTTYAFIGERFMIWGTCVFAGEVGLEVKQAGSATTTLSVGQNTTSNSTSLMGLYTAPATGAIEIYMGNHENGTRNYASCGYPTIMYQRFDP
jgi:hypothetical protein